LVVVRRLEWDEWNLEHVVKHGVTPSEVEEACHGHPLEFRRSYKNRLIVIGTTENGRIISVVLGQVPDAAPGVYYVFTARPPDRKERRFYEQAQERPIEQ
jgi:uncharacterized DUF497 family protein